MTGPSMAIGDNTIFTLEPSASLVSTIGIASLIVLFDIAAILCAISSSFSLLSNCLFHLVILPFFSINISLYPLIIISVISSSSSNSCNISRRLIESCCLKSSLLWTDIALCCEISYIHTSITLYKSSSDTSRLISSFS